jgi:hypothetical protein
MFTVESNPQRWTTGTVPPVHATLMCRHCAPLGVFDQRQSVIAHVPPFVGSKS